MTVPYLPWVGGIGPNGKLKKPLITTGDRRSAESLIRIFSEMPDVPGAVMRLRPGDRIMVIPKYEALPTLRELFGQAIRESK